MHGYNIKLLLYIAAVPIEIDYRYLEKFLIKRYGRRHNVYILQCISIFFDGIL